jgi:class 3 adenylate cyclase/tetratricopeptide (TPR) repeat protein
MKCPECQFDNREGAKFCKKCGAKLELACPQCKSVFAADSIFCDECGYDLRQPEKVPPVDYSQPQFYTPKFLAEKILTTRSSIEGERKLVTVLFADVANYTAMSEKLDPEEIHQIMDGCFKILMDEIHKYEGTINQFTGDGIMAIFGAPVSHEDHGKRACYAALRIQDAIGDYGVKVKKDCGIEFRMRIGINSGPVIVGSIGDDLRMDYTAVGDTTNLASRMESEALPGSILVSKNTHKIAGDFFEFEPIGKVEVKGKREPQAAYELIKTGVVETRIEASVAKGLTKFVGRRNSMAALKEPYESVLAGSGQVVGIVGEAGVGKSRLLYEFINQLSIDDVTCLDGRCLHYGGSMIYMPILEILKTYFDIKEEDREFIINKKIEEKIAALDEKITGVIAPFQELLSIKVEDEAYLALEPKQKREKIFEALRDLFIKESQSRPLVLAIEDLHWIDRTSEEFLDYLIGWIANARMMLILLYRPEYTHQWGSQSYYSQIGLTQLGTSSSSQLIKAILEKGEVAPELRQLILNRAAGNPLFMEEFTYSLIENGSIQKKDLQFVLSTNAADIQVPDTIQGIIAARMDRLEDNLKRTMQMASVIGREFAFRILQTITGMREEIKSYLLNLQGLEFIYEKSLFPELEYIFKHALTQEVAYNSLLLKRRSEIHKRIGEAIEELYPERLEEFFEMLAYHYSKGEDFKKALEYLKFSGNKAIRNHSVCEAYQFYNDAIDTLNQFSETEEYKQEKLEVLNLVTIPIMLLGYPEDSLRMLEEGERLSKELGDDRHLGIFRGRISSYYTHKGNPLLSMKFSEDAIEVSLKNQDIELIVSTAHSLFASYTATGRFNKIVNKAPGILDLIERTQGGSEVFAGGMGSYSILCAYCGMSMGCLGNFKEGKIFLDKGLRMASEIDNLRTLGFVELFYGIFFIAKGNWKLAIEHLQDVIEYLEEVKWLLGLAMAQSFFGLAYSFLGDPQTGKRHAEKGFKIHHDSGIEWNLSVNQWILGVIHFHLSDLKNARSFVDEALTLSKKNNEKHFEGNSWIWLGKILESTQIPQIDKAEECILKGIEIFYELQLKPSYASGHLFLGELYLNTNEKEMAIKNLKKAREMFQEMGMDYGLAGTQEVLAKV